MAVDQPAAARGPQTTLAAGQLVHHFVCRVGGLPVRTLEMLRAEASADACAALVETENKLRQLQDGLTEALYQAVNGLQDRQLRRRLLKLKRHVHNLRAFSSTDLAAVEEVVPKELRDTLQRYHQLGRHRRETHGRLQETYLSELFEIRRRFQTLVEDEDFKKGLLLSSRTLSAELKRYTHTPVERPGSKVRQIERSLLRYFSRMVMKATPFGTFCAIVPGIVGQGRPQDEHPTFRGEPRHKRSHLRLNKSLLAILLEHLTRRPGVREHLPVELNPTLGEEEGRWLFLSANHGVEVFQRLDKNPVIELLRRRLEGVSHIPLGTLARELLTNAEIDATEEEATAYVDRLLEIGLFRFRLGIREQEVDWDLPLRQILAAIEDHHALLICQFLEQLRDDMEACAEAPTEERRGLIENASKRMRFVFEEIGARLQTSAEMPPFYEDAAGQASLEIPAAGITQPIAEYVGLTARLSWLHGEQASIRHFFDTCYGDPQPVPLLRFYEDFYRQHFKAHLERQRHPGGAAAGGEEITEEPEADGEGPETADDGETYDLQNPFRLALIEAIKKAHEGLGERIRELWRGDLEAEEITLEKGDLEVLLSDIPAHPEPCRSVSLFGQYLPGFAPDGGPALVANGYLNGYGKYFSRHLYLLPQEVQEDLRASNLLLTDQEMAEICGDASFNANLHPPLFAWEVSYPTGESGATEAQIKSSDLYVEPDPHNPFHLCLRHQATGKQVVPVDLGFLNPRMRPPLYQLLSRFTPPASFHIQIPESAERPPTPEEHGKNQQSNQQTAAQTSEPDAPGAPSQGVPYRPRVTYRGRLVLARRCWWIFPGMFPRRQPDESEADYFLRVWHWREEFKLPVEVFIKVRSLPARAAKSGEKEAEKDSKRRRRRRRQHLYKPQYIDFKNPLLVDLFSRAAENLEHFVITMEERLPGREHLLQSGDGDESYATEFVLQVDFRGARDAG